MYLTINFNILMIVKPINSVIKKQFQSLFNTATETANKEFKTNIENKLKGLDDFHKLKFLVAESEKLKSVIEKSEYTFYIENHSSENWLLNQFASRAFLLNVDESKQLSEAIALGSYDRLISEKKWELKENIPAYSYEDFILGKIDPYLTSFENYYNITEEDYYKIKQWQTEYLIKIITYESLMLIKNIQQHCTTLKNPLEFIIAEKEKIEINLDKAGGNATKIKSALNTLFIFKNQNLNHFKDDLLYENYDFYKSEKINWKFISPFYLTSIIKKVNQNPKKLFSNEVTIFFTINKICEWLETVIAGQPIQQPVIESDWNKLYEGIENEATSRIEHLVNEICLYVENPQRSKREIKQYLIEQLEIYRHKFNAFDAKYMFALLREEKKYMLKEMFRTNSFFGNELEEQTKCITEALVIQEVAWEICGIYGNIFDTHKIDFPDKDAAHIEIMFLMHQMVLDKELHNSMGKIMDDFMEHFHSYSLPIEIHFQNNRVMMNELFHKALDRLQTHLEDAEPTNKILFMQSRLKQLRHRELELKKHEHEKYFSKKEYRYSKLFKEFLQIEAEFINQTKDLKVIPILSGSKQVLLPSPTAHTFDSLLPDTKGVFVLKMLENLSITTNGTAILSERRKGALRGVIIALKENYILPDINNTTLCFLIAAKINLSLKSYPNDSTTSNDFRIKASKYIKENYNP